MPRAPKQCGRNGCTNVIRTGEKCPDHPHGWHGRPRTASSMATSGANTAAWQKVRADVLRDAGYVCQIAYPGICTGYATTVDKKKPAAQRPDLAHEPSNLQAACAECNLHKARTTDRSAG